MTRIREIKTTFTGGEVSPELLGRGDLRAYENGALTLRNVFINPTGGVTRRAGLSFIDNAVGDGRLISFEFNAQQNYLLVLTHQRIDVYANGVHITNLSAPWTLDQIPQVAWTQSADTLIIAHPDVQTKKLTRNSGGTWSLNDFVFHTQNNIINQPYYKYADSSVTLALSGTSGPHTATCSAGIFSAAYVGTRLHFKGCEMIVTGYTSPTVLSVNILQTVVGGVSADIDWQEQAFSAMRGYPSTVAFHQDRLVIGGSRDLPNRMWFSRSGDLFNFNLGTGLDDEAIEFTILSDQVNAIRGIFSGRHLQVFTSGAEWMVTGDPLTPSEVQIRRQTQVGSVIGRHIPPVNVDGATLFVGRNQQEVQEFLYTDVEQAYQSTDLVLLAPDIAGTLVAQDYDASRRLLFVIRDDGKFATFTIFRTEQVGAWTLHETDGLVKSVSVVGDEVYVLTHRNGAYRIELFDDELNLDSALTGTAGSPTTMWSGLDHLEGKSVSIVADGFVQASKVVSSGDVTLDTAASSVEIGLPYTHIIEPLPPNAMGPAGSGRRVRLVRSIFRLYDSATLMLDTGQGPQDIPLRHLGEEPDPSEPLPLVTGDYAVRALGWQSDATKPLWRIEQDTPLPFTLLSVTTELKVNE